MVNKTFSNITYCHNRSDKLQTNLQVTIDIDVFVPCHSLCISLLSLAFCINIYLTLCQTICFILFLLPAHMHRGNVYVAFEWTKSLLCELIRNSVLTRCYYFAYKSLPNNNIQEIPFCIICIILLKISIIFVYYNRKQVNAKHI